MADDVTDPTSDAPATPDTPAQSDAEFAEAVTDDAAAPVADGTASAEAPTEAAAEAPTESAPVTADASTASAEAPAEDSATTAEAPAEDAATTAEDSATTAEAPTKPAPAKPVPAKPTRPDWPIGLTVLGYGGDYNPEQWPMATRLEDIELMREAGVNFVSLAIFAWASIEPREGRYEWAWLDNIMDRLSAAGIKVALATATASPPPWLTMKHPEILPRTAEGVVLNQGGRQSYAPSSTVYRDYAVKMAKAMAERYAEHPALALWHIDNEIGCHVPHDFSDSAIRAFRTWLRRKYRTIERLNDSWGTAFWSQRYGAFKDVLPPLAAPTYANPSQQLDFARFSSDTLLEYYRKLRDAVRPITPNVPATTNFMVSLNTKWMDYFRWAQEVDLVATDHYTIAADPEREIDLALAADMTRGVAGGKRWILMEHSSAAVNWQPHNRAKGPGEMLRNSLAHVARGADSVMFFQFRASKAGAEKFHSALVPHAGRESAIWRDSVRLGEVLTSLAPVAGSTVRAKVALVFDYQAWWATELDSHPSEDVSYGDRIRALYRDLWYRGIAVDVLPPTGDLSGYDLVLVPTLYLVTDDGAANIAAAAENGATVAITYFSGIVDENDQIRLGGYPGAFRELLGVRTDEFFPLLPGEQVTLDDGTSADVWTERIETTTAEVVRSFTDGPLPGGPAITRNAVGEGAAWYIATRQDAAGTTALLDALLAESGVSPEAEVPRGVEAVRRTSEDGTGYLFLLNHTEEQVQVPANGTDLVTGTDASGSVTLAAGAVAVVQEP